MGVIIASDGLGTSSAAKVSLKKAMREEEDRALKAPDSGLAGQKTNAQTNVQPKGVNADKGYLA